MFKLLTFVLVLLSLNIAQADDLQAQLDAQQHTMLMMQNNLQQMQNDLQAVNGQLEELRHELEHLKELNQTLKPQESTVTPPELTPKSQETAAATPAPAPVPPTPPVQSKAPAVQDDAGKEAYDKAYALVNQNDLQGAEQAFGDFIKTYPEHPLVPNAWYWQGQVQYKKANYEAARVSFLNAAKYNDSPKRPDALLKLGKITEQLGDKEKAKRYYEVLISTYPNDTSALMAKKELAKL